LDDGHRPPESDGGLTARERAKVEGRFGAVLLLLFAAVFISVAAPNGSWSVLLTTVLLAASLAVAMRASARGRGPCWRGGSSPRSASARAY
jgi:cobalamin synthase